MARAILAVAGSGKTTRLGKNLNPNEINLIVTFTNQNVDNIVTAVEEFQGSIPKNTQIITYSKFLFYWLIRPFERTIAKEFEVSRFNSNGIEINDPPEHDRNNPNNGYIMKKSIYHYLSKETNKFYNSRMSELYLDMKFKYQKMVRHRLEKFVDNLYFDEFQDFTYKDFDLLKNITKCKNISIEFTGDFYQSLVIKSNSKKGRPYSNNSYLDFKKELYKNNINIDEESLNTSYRVSNETAIYIQKYLKIPINGRNNFGKVICINSLNEAKNILFNNNIIKLFYNKSSIGYESCSYRNKWGYSKGNTYNGTCIILTKKSNLFLQGKINKLSNSTLNKLYVALTRSNSNTYLIEPDIVKKVIKSN